MTLRQRPQGVSRIVYYEVVDGDRRKAEAKSNDDPTQGGGARDLRFPLEFHGVLQGIFPGVVHKTRKDRKTGQRVQIQIHTGVLVWEQEGGVEATGEVEVWPPTNSRPREVRIARIHTLPAFWNIPSDPHGRLYLFLIQSDDGTVRAHFADEAILASSAFNQSVARAVMTCAEETGESARVMGYIDYAQGDGHCHGE